jgi:hypothetical protein
MIKNTASQVIGAQMISATDGSAFAGTVTCYFTIDGGSQTIGSVGSGVCTHEGNGYHTYAPAQAETNGSLIAFTFIGTGAVPSTVQVETQIALQTGDSFARIGAAGASLTAITGVTLAATTGLGNQTANITGNLSGSVGSVTGAVVLPTGTGAGQISLSSGAVLLQPTQTGVTIPTVTTVATVTNITNERSKYMHGAVWIGAVANTNTASYVDGIMTNPVSTIAAAKTIADNLGIKRFWIQSGVTVTLGAAYVGYIFDGKGWILALGGQDISKSQFERAEQLSGTGIGTTGEAVFFDCHLGPTAITIGEADFTRCHLNGTVTMSQATVPYLFNQCVGIVNSKITFAAANQSCVIAKWSGTLTIAGMVSTNTLYLDGDGDVTFDNTNNSGVVIVSGNIRVTDSGTTMNITRAQVAEVLLDTNELQAELVDGGRTDLLIDAILADTNELQTDWANGGRLDLILDAASAPSAATVADAVWDEALSGHSTAGTSGKKLTDLVNADLSGVATATALATVDTEVGDIKAKTDKMTYTSGDDLDVNIQKVNDVALTGNGTVATPWGPV